MNGDGRGSPEDPGGPSDERPPPVLDPRVARAAHRRRTSPSAGLVYLRALSAVECRWLEGMVANTARTYRVDPDDLLQDLRLSLLDCDAIDHGRRGVRAWLRRRAHWKAADRLRRDRRASSRSVPIEDVAHHMAAPEPAGPDRSWDLDRLSVFKLSRDEAQVVLLTCWGFDVSLRDFAELVERSYAKTRQDKVRGLRKIEELFDLEPAERAAFIAFREFGTHAAAAIRLDLPEHRLRDLVRRAENKINRTLGNVPEPVGKEGTLPMSTEDELGRSEPADHRLHAALARMAWAAAPTARLYYHRGDDSLVVELVEADAAVEVLVLDRLLVEFDGDDAAALPTTVYLTGLRAEPDAPAVSVALDVLGEDIWAAAMALVASGSSRADLGLEAAEAAGRRAAWRGLGGRLRNRARSVEVRSPEEDRLIGVEIVPGRVSAVLTDGAATVLDDVLIRLDRNDPAAVVEAIAAAVRELAARHPGTAAETCPVGVQLGGPVDTVSGTVEYYNKSLHDDDEHWKAVPIGELLRVATGRRVSVFNDAAALAAHEVQFGFGAERSSIAILLVGDGIGAKLVRHGRVETFPMEIGILVFEPGEMLEGAHSRRAASIEAKCGLRAIIEAVDKVVEGHTRTIDEAASAAGTPDAR